MPLNTYLPQSTGIGEPIYVGDFWSNIAALHVLMLFLAHFSLLVPRHHVKSIP